MRLAGAFATGFSHLHVPSCLLSPPGSGDPILPTPHSRVSLSGTTGAGAEHPGGTTYVQWP